MGLLGAVLVGNAVLSAVNVNRMALGLCFAILALSLVPLTGFSGYVSLAQFSFFGVGALTVAKTHSSAPTAVLLGAVLAAAAGVVVALPSLRLQGLYLALSTIAFAQIMDSMVFQNPSLGGFGGRCGRCGWRCSGCGSRRTGLMRCWRRWCSA
ncbi:hypothetical protein ACFQ9X_02120 [Catenulispora yoronensis]